MECLTCDALPAQLGELRLFSIGESSESGRGMALAIFVGVFLDRRKGCTLYSIRVSLFPPLPF
jgi:hypothetical protein